MFDKMNTKGKLLLFPIIFLVIIILLGMIYSHWSEIANKRNESAIKTDQFIQQVLKGRISVYQFLRLPNDKTAQKVREDFELLNKNLNFRT
jgi:methyl-accepting chemotaxis protein